MQKWEIQLNVRLFTQIGCLPWQKRKTDLSKNKNLNQIGLLCK